MNKFLFSLFLFFSGLSFSANAEVAIDTNNLELKFSEFGDLVSVRSCLPACSDPLAKAQVFDSYRGFVSLNRDSGVLFEMHRVSNDKSVQLIFSNSFTNEVRSWKIPHTGWLLGLELSRSQDMAMTSGESFQPPEVAGFGAWLETLRYVIFEQGGISQLGIEEETVPLMVERDWLGYRNRFWAAMIRPEVPVDVELRSAKDKAEAQLDLSPVDPGPARFLIYAGPIEPQSLQSAHPDLEGLMYSGLWFWLRWICQAFFHLLTAIQSAIPGWGTAIILMSLIISTLMRPLNRVAERLQDGVRQTESRISPALTQIKRDYKGAEQAERIIALYKEEGVHPLYSMKSLLGVLLVIPVFIGAFNMLSENIWLSGESFFWIKDLSLSDAFAELPFTIPFLGNHLNLLPIIMVTLSISGSATQGASHSDPVLKTIVNRNLLLMSLMFFLLFYTFPAGMVLYWVVNNAISLITGLFKRNKV